jgi:hypothetical protein
VTAPLAGMKKTTAKPIAARIFFGAKEVKFKPKIEKESAI